ncbi:MAG: GMC family oxidoreductase [Pseudomonadota bacterium]
MAGSPTYPTREAVDFVVIGSGAAGGVMARELSVAGFNVVVLEQGPYRRAHDFTHDEIGVVFQGELSLDPAEHPQTFRARPEQNAEVPPQGAGLPPAWYAAGVGGSSVHFTGNYWRFRPVDFKERSLLGEIEGTTFADWPLTYEELEPYYTRVDWEIGVSGAPGPFDPPRSRPYPVPPLPLKSSGAILERGAKALGLHPQVAPMAILSKPHNGRPACIHCGFCLGFGCEMNAKSSTLAAMIPQAEATGRCEIRTGCTVMRLEHDERGRIRDVVYLDENGVEQAQRTRAAVLSANGAESARLLLLSQSAQHPDGMANGSGMVGKNLMFNAHSATHAWFEEPLNEFKSVQCTRIVHDFYETDPKRGFYGGGGIDARPLVNSWPILFAMGGIAPGLPTWGAEYKRLLERYFTRNMSVLGNCTSLAMERNSISLDPELKDVFGRPAVRVTYEDHPDDLATARFMQDQSVAILEAAGAQRLWRDEVRPSTGGPHLLGTCRMGDDPDRSVVDRYHRAHEVNNLFVVDGSNFVTSGRGQPTMTIQALAFRAAEHMTKAARAGEI